MISCAQLCAMCGYYEKKKYCDKKQIGTKNILKLCPTVTRSDQTKNGTEFFLKGTHTRGRVS